MHCLPVSSKVGYEAAFYSLILLAKEMQLLPKSPTGIIGLDEITGGGLPSGRPTLVCGSAGCGKTMLATEFLVRGAVEFGEPGVFMMFEENAAELTANVRSLGFDLNELVKQNKMILDHVHIERSEIEETGEYDLEGLFIRLGYAIDSIGAKRVVLDHRVTEQISTRRLRVLKYRGSAHGTNEYPFLIGERGISVLPITSLQLDHAAPVERLSTGIVRLDEMLGGQGVFCGSSVLVSGSPGTGKTSIAATFVDAACRRGERALLFAYEESSAQILRNMQSIGIDLAPWVKEGLFKIHASRPTLQGLEQHLVAMHDTVKVFQPAVVVVDPISNLTLDRSEAEAKPTLMRLIDFLKQQQITTLFTSLTTGGNGTSAAEDSQVNVSSLMDTWLLLRNVELNGERNRLIFVLKSRGMAHSNQVREFVLSDAGIDLVDVVLGADRVLTGTARMTQASLELSATELRRVDQERKLRKLASRRKAIEAQIAALQAESEAEEAEVQFAIAQEASQEKITQQNIADMTQLRSGLKTTDGDHA